MSWVGLGLIFAKMDDLERRDTYAERTAAVLANALCSGETAGLYGHEYS